MSLEVAKLAILAVDDDEAVRLYLKTLLGKQFQVWTAANRQEALAILKEKPIDIVLLDLILSPGDDGLAHLKAIKQTREDVDVIVISGISMVQTVVQTMKEGAIDYIEKPIEKEVLFLALSRVIKQRELLNSNQRLKTELSEQSAYNDIIGESFAIATLKDMVARLQGQNVNVFIVGDTGTGKEMFARLIHKQEGNRERPFVSVNCAAIPENLLESMLFGHEKGAFTGATERRIGKFELAHGGDIFLDEISCLTPELQAKLLRVIEEKEVERVGSTVAKKVEFRVIAASNDNILRLVATGAFRKDLFYRLNTVTLQLPTLNQRREDIIPLAEYFLQKYRRTPQVKTLSSEVKAILKNHNWRGNIRELKNTIENMLIFSQGTVIEVADLPFLVNEANHEETYTTVQPSSSAAAAIPIPVNLGNYQEALKSYEREIILRSLERNRWNKTKTCREIGIKRNKLYRKMNELGIEFK